MTAQLDGFYAMIRKHTHKCISRVSESRNEIIICLVNKVWSHVVKMDNFSVSEMTDHKRIIVLFYVCMSIGWVWV